MNEIHRHEHAPAHLGPRPRHPPTTRRRNLATRFSRHPASYPLFVAVSVLLLLGIGIAHDRGNLNLAVTLLAFAAVLAVVVLASRASAE
jgi:hypothetical protein